MTRLLLARHAETVWHAENRYAGCRSEPELTELGLRQAEQLAKAAVAIGVDAVVSSPQQRAVTTATPAAEALGVPLHVQPGLREVDFGDLEGHTLGEMDPEAVRRFREDPEENAFPGAEPIGEAGARGAAALREVGGHREVGGQHWAAGQPDHLGGTAPSGLGVENSTVLVVAHSTLFRVALCVLLGLPVKHYRRVFPALDNVALTEIRLPADPAHPASLISLNRAQ